MARSPGAGRIDIHVERRANPKMQLCRGSLLEHKLTKSMAIVEALLPEDAPKTQNPKPSLAGKRKDVCRLQRFSAPRCNEQPARAADGKGYRCSILYPSTLF